LRQVRHDFIILHQNQGFQVFGIPCEPPSDEAKPGAVKRALSERVARVAQRPVWLRNVGEVGEPGAPSFWLLFLGEARISNQPPGCPRHYFLSGSMLRQAQQYYERLLTNRFFKLSVTHSQLMNNWQVHWWSLLHFCQRPAER
jgi:hypothetical protein